MCECVGEWVNERPLQGALGYRECAEKSSKSTVQFPFIISDTDAKNVTNIYNQIGSDGHLFVDVAKEQNTVRTN